MFGLQFSFIVYEAPEYIVILIKVSEWLSVVVEKH